MSSRLYFTSAVKQFDSTLPPLLRANSRGRNMTNNSLVSTSHTSRGSPLLSASPVGALPADVAAAREEEEEQQQQQRKEEASLPSPLKAGSPPRHVAVIMDGNSRWARARDLPTLAGRVAGYRPLKKIVDLSSLWGIRAFTVFAFSSENWRRPKAEVDFLMMLLEGVLKEREHRRFLERAPSFLYHHRRMKSRKSVPELDLDV